MINRCPQYNLMRKGWIVLYLPVQFPSLLAIFRFIFGIYIEMLFLQVLNSALWLSLDLHLLTWAANLRRISSHTRFSNTWCFPLQSEVQYQLSPPPIICAFNPPGKWKWKNSRESKYSLNLEEVLIPWPKNTLIRYFDSLPSSPWLLEKIKLLQI